MKNKKYYQRNEKIIKLIACSDLWKPNLSEVARLANTEKTTVQGIFQRMKRSGKFTVKVDYTMFGELKWNKKKQKYTSSKPD